MSSGSNYSRMLGLCILEQLGRWDLQDDRVRDEPSLQRI